MLDGFLTRIPQNCGAAWAVHNEMMASTLRGIEEVGSSRRLEGRQRLQQQQACRGMAGAILLVVDRLG
jgi:hypothetical protein